MSNPYPSTLSINPGDDFFRYANTAWLNAHPIPADKQSYGVFDVLSDAAKESIRTYLEAPALANEPSGIRVIRSYYSSAMDEASVEADGTRAIAAELEAIKRIDSVEALQHFIIDCDATGASIIWSYEVNLDGKDSSAYLMRLSQAGLGLPDRDFYLETDEKMVEIQSAYRSYLERVLSLVGYPNAAAAAKMVYDIEYKLAESSLDSVSMRDPDNVYNKISITQLASTFPGFDWSTYLISTGLDATQAINIDEPDFITSVVKLMQSESLETWRAYLTVRYVAQFTAMLPKAYLEASFDFYGRVLSGVTEMQPRYRRVIGHLVNVLMEPAGEVFVREAFSEQAKQSITHMVELIKTALGKRIDKLDWMSDATKLRAHEKLGTFISLLGYPDHWRDYADLELSGSYAAMAKQLAAYEWRDMVTKLARPVDRSAWVMSPALLNAWNWPEANSITFPAAILQPPFFTADGDMATNFGAIGSVIGHEIIHSFDDEGSKFDAYGNLSGWWSETDRAAFNRLAERLALEYDHYAFDGQHVNGHLTLGENIADLGGQLAALDALMAYQSEGGELAETIDGHTIAQRFFLGQAHVWSEAMRPEYLHNTLISDEHPPYELRVNGVVKNIDAFYDAFAVQPTDALYKAPEDRIRIW